MPLHEADGVQHHNTVLAQRLNLHAGGLHLVPQGELSKLYVEPSTEAFAFLKASQVCLFSANVMLQSYSCLNHTKIENGSIYLTQVFFGLKPLWFFVEVLGIFF